jgi:divalent metal cation (Fe/Co/Zn/Cd) transporter
MRAIDNKEFPAPIDTAYRRARTVAWWSIAYIVSSSLMLYLTMGGSQAMKTSFMEDAVSATPAIAFLICTSMARRPAGPDWPYGRHRATSIGHLIAALALSVLGVMMAMEGGVKLLAREQVTIGHMTLFGHTVWAGWPMMMALLYTSVPSFFLGRLKQRLAGPVHDKILHADAQMMRADWMSEAATAIGVLGLGVGVWWLDPLAAVVVSLSIMRDGFSNLHLAVADLANRRPKQLDGRDWDPVPHRVRDRLRALDWVEDADVRMRDEGHILMGEAFIVPRAGTTDLVSRLDEAARAAAGLDWRVHQLVIMPVRTLERPSAAK